MPSGQTFIVRQHTRDLIKGKVDTVPEGFVVNISAPKRTLDQNAKFYAMLSDISRSCPEGRRHSPDVWKAILMNACGHEVQFTTGLSGEPFPLGYRSSRLTKQQMSELIEMMIAYGDQNGVEWSVKEGDEDV